MIMTTDELINKSEDFLKEYETIVWKPILFPEDMTEESTIYDLESEGTDMYYALEKAKDLIHELIIELECK